MDFKPASQNGIIPPTDYYTLQSKFAVMASTSTSYQTRQVIFKAVSDADIYKENFVTWYVSTNSGATAVLGTSSWSTNISPFIVTTLGTGTNLVWATWAGQDKFAPQSTQTVPLSIYVNPTTPVGASITLSADKASGTQVSGESVITISAFFSPSIPITQGIQWYVNDIYYGTSPVLAGRADFVFTDLPIGVNVIRAVYPGENIAGVDYAAEYAQINYEMLLGSTATDALNIFINGIHGYTNPIVGNNAYNVLGEGILSVNAWFNSSTVYAGVITIKDQDNRVLGTSTLINNTTSFFIPGTEALFPVPDGVSQNYNIRAEWDGNPTGHPRYFPKSSSNAAYTVVQRDTVRSFVLTQDSTSTVFNQESITLTSEIITPSSSKGVVNFYDNGSLVASINNPSASAIRIDTVELFGLSTGTHNFYAVYQGSATAPKQYPATSNTVTNTVLAGYTYTGTFSVSATPNPVSSLQDLVLTASLTGGTTATGYVEFVDQVIVPVSTTTVFTGTNYGSITDFGYNVNSFGTVFGPFNYIQPYIYVSNTSGLTVGQTFTVEAKFRYISPGTFGSNGYPVISNYRIESILGNKVIFSSRPSDLIADQGLELITYQGTDSNIKSFAAFYGGYEQYPFDVIWEANQYQLSQGGTVDQILKTQFTWDTTIVSTITNVVTEIVIGTANFNNSLTTSLVYNPINLPNYANTSTHRISANWSSGYINGKPYFGVKSANTVTLAINTQSFVMSLSKSTATNVYGTATTVTLTLNTNTTKPLIYNLLDGATTIASTASSTGTAVFAISTLTTGTHVLKGIITTGTTTIESNTSSLVIVGKTTATAVMSFNPTAFEYASSSTGALNTSSIAVTATIYSPSSYTNPTGTFNIVDSVNGIIATGTLTNAVYPVIGVGPTITTTFTRNFPGRAFVPGIIENAVQVRLLSSSTIYTIINTQYTDTYTSYAWTPELPPVNYSNEPIEIYTTATYQVNAGQGTVTIRPSNYSWIPGNRNLQVEYSGDSWWTTATSTSSYTINKTIPPITVTTIQLKQNIPGSGFIPGIKDYVVSFPLGSDKPTSVNWYEDGDGQSGTVPVINSTATFTIESYRDSHNISVTYTATSIYSGAATVFVQNI